MKHRDTMLQVCRACVDAAYHEARAEALHYAASLMAKAAGERFVNGDTSMAVELRDQAARLRAEAGVDAAHSERFDGSISHTCTPEDSHADA